MHRLAWARGVALALALTGCKNQAPTIDQLAAALTAKGLEVTTVEPTADEKLALEKFKALATALGSTPPSYEEFRDLSINGIRVGVTRYGSAFSARSATKEAAAEEAKTDERDQKKGRPHFSSHFFSHGPYAFEVYHSHVDAAPGGRIDLGSYREVPVDPTEEARLERTVKTVKVGLAL